jgi:ribosomal protein S5
MNACDCRCACPETNIPSLKIRRTSTCVHTVHSMARGLNIGLMPAESGMGLEDVELLHLGQMRHAGRVSL